MTIETGEGRVICDKSVRLIGTALQILLLTMAESVCSLIHSSLLSNAELPERGSLIFQSDLILRAIPRRAACSRKKVGL